MKKTFKFSAVISIFAILVCFVVLMAPQVYAAEAGTTVSNPIILTEDTYYTKYWTEENCDLNCYSKMEIPSRGYITFTIVKPYDSDGQIGSYDLMLYTPEGEVVWGGYTGEMVNSFSDTYVYKIGLDAGTYYMNLDPCFWVDSGSISSQFKYSFTATTDWEIESNGEMINATFIELEKMYCGVYCEEKYGTIGIDMYAVNLEAGKKYDIKIDNYVKLDLGTTIAYLIDTTGKDMGFPDEHRQAGTTYIWTFAPDVTGTYYIVFCNDGNSAPVEYKVGVYEYICNHTPEILKEASCTTKAICANCGEEYGELDPTYHSYLGPLLEVEATCTEPGLTLGYKCFDCGVVKTPQEVIPAKGHVEEVVPALPADCTTIGRTAFTTCTVCREILVPYEIIPATGHKDVTIKGKAATCTEKGLTEGKKCSVCGTVTVVQKEIPALGHTEEVITGKEATCTEEGVTEGKKCSVCGVTIVVQCVIDATGHKTVAIPAKKATYTSTGLTAGKKCSVCGKVTVKQKKVAKKKLKKVTISSVKSTKAKQAVVNWKKVSDTTGYIVEYSTSKKFTKKTTKKVTVKKAKSKKTTLKKLKSGKKYYIRIRAYKTVGKKTVYGAYSSVKTVKVK